MELRDRYYLDLAVSYLFCNDEIISTKYRNYLHSSHEVEDIDIEIKEQILQEGKDAGHKLRRFKKIELDRVKKCTGILKGLNPSNITDIGTGRGNFLHYALYNGLSNIRCIEADNKHVTDISRCLFLTKWNKECHASHKVLGQDKIPRSDVITAFEVLEHIEDWESALKDCINSAIRYVLISVPSKEDTNPEHLQVITPEKMQNAINNIDKNIKLKVQGVANHYIYLLKL
jgi:2-polyprenyl-3-methyl-5-hydroxy-6-metoxy-1,4-benzoquinol methylase